MTSTESISKRLKRLSREIPDDNITRTLIRELERQDNHHLDRSIAIITSAVMEKALEVATRAKFSPFLTAAELNALFLVDNAPLSTFSRRIQMGYALGLFGKRTRDDLDLLRWIRNQFAHSAQYVSFKTDEIAEACAALKTKTAFKDTILTPATPKSRYIDCGLHIVSELKRAISDTQPSQMAWLLSRPKTLP